MVYQKVKSKSIILKLSEEYGSYLVSKVQYVELYKFKGELVLKRSWLKPIQIP